MKVVRFKQPMAPYNAGETAGFSDFEADNLVTRGIAEHTGIEPTVAGRSPDLDPPAITGRDIADAMASAEQRERAAGMPKAPKS